MLQVCLASLLLFLVNSKATSSSDFHPKWIFSIFNKMNIGALNIYGCSDKDSHKIHEYNQNKNNPFFISVKGNKNEQDIYPSFNAKHHLTGGFYDFSCNTSKEIFYKVSNHMLLNMSFVHIILSDDYDRTLSILKNSTLAYDSIVFLATNGSLYGLYRIEPGWDIISNEVGTYDENNVDLNTESYSKRYDLNGTAIRSILVLTRFPYDGSPESYKRLLDPTIEPESDFLSRLGLSIHLLFEPVFNFRIVFEIVEEWGEYDEVSGTWPKGMFYKLDQNKADLGLPVSRIFTRRMDVVFFYPPSTTYRSCFIFKHPSTLATLTALVKPFSPALWTCTMGFVLTSSISLWYLRRRREEGEQGLTGTMLLVLAALCQQGLIKDCNRLATRIFSFFILLVSLLIYTFYGAAVVGFLLRPSPRTINTIDKLIQSPLTKYSENLVYIKTHMDKPWTYEITRAHDAIKGKTPQEDRYIDLMRGMSLVQKGGTALYSQDRNLYSVIQQTFTGSDICALAEIEIVKFGISPMIRKKSPFRELICRGLELLRGSGILKREGRKWHTPHPECLALEDSTSVTLEATVVAHIIYTSGFLLSLSIFIIEIYNRVKYPLNFT